MSFLSFAGIIHVLNATHVQKYLCITQMEISAIQVFLKNYFKH